MKPVSCLVSLFVFFLVQLNYIEVAAQYRNFSAKSTWHITDFGARGDSQTLNTAFIQQAINTCSAAGGGTVQVPAGNFLTGTLFLKSGVRLYLEENAILTGSALQQDYIPVHSVNALGNPRYGNLNSFLIYAENANHISIEGNGTIKGNGPAFWENEMHANGKVRKPKTWRPRALLHFVNCRNITIRNIHLADAPTYTVWPLGCENIELEGITILNPEYGPNTDGIDIDCSRNVTISNCDIAGGDDAIAIKSDAAILGTAERPCENIRISNCKLSSPPACGIRIGYEGDSPIRNVTCDNITVSNSAHGIDIISILPDRPEPFLIKKGARIEQIYFNNFRMQDVKQPIYLWMGQEKSGPAAIQISDVHITNLLAENAGDSYIGGIAGKPVKNIYLTNIRINLSPDLMQTSRYYTGVWGSNNPYALYIGHVTNLHIDNFISDFSVVKGKWKNAIFCREAKDVVIQNVQTRGVTGKKLTAQIAAEHSMLLVHNNGIANTIPLIIQDKATVVRYQ